MKNVHEEYKENVLKIIKEAEGKIRKLAEQHENRDKVKLWNLERMREAYKYVEMSVWQLNAMYNVFGVDGDIELNRLYDSAEQLRCDIIEKLKKMED
jgi:hypothetical protein